MSKKAALQQAFVYIITSIVIIVTLSFGYQSVNWFVGQQEKVNEIEFKTSLEQDIKGLTNEHGSIQKLEYKISNQYSKVCFLDYKNNNGSVEANDPVYVYDIVNMSSGPNVIVVKADKAISFQVDRIRLVNDQKVECYDVESGYLKITAKSKGDRIMIS